MPLRDHFGPPVTDITYWAALHSMWPGNLVRHLRQILPPGFRADPGVKPGIPFEIDVSTFDSNYHTRPDSDRGTGLLTSPCLKPTLEFETEVLEFDEYEVKITTTDKTKQLVAAIEIVSPANKDRPESRNAFVSKCAMLLKHGVSVMILDLVTLRHFNLYTELLEHIGQKDPSWSDDPPSIYAAECRWVMGLRKGRFEAWTSKLTVGEMLPTLPLCLTPTLEIQLDLNISYEEACTDLGLNDLVG